MRTGWTISIALHAAAGFALLFAIPQPERDRELMVVSDVTLESMPAFEPQREQAPEIQDITLPEIEAPAVDPDAGETPDEDIAPVATVQDFVEDPSERDAAADLSAVAARLIQPEVAVDVDAPEESAPEQQVPILALPGTGLDNRTESPKGPTLSAPSAPRSAPAAFKPPAPPSRATPAPEETPPTEAVPDATETAEQQEETAPEESSDVPVAEQESGAEEGIALKQARPPRPRPKDFQQQLAAAAEQREQEERRAAEEAEARAVAEALAEAEAERAAAAAAQRETEAETSVERSAAADVPVGPPMTEAEVEGLKLQVARCWRLPEGVAGAEELRVVLSVELDPTGSVVGDPKLIEPANPQSRAIQSAYGAARRAILRCQGSGFDLPREKYQQWRNLELVFEPRGVLARW